MTEAHLDPKVRHDFVLLYDVEGGNPNGDPDNANHPRTDPETGELWVTDVAIKRKVRDFIADAYEDEPGMAIHVRNGTALNQHHREASEAIKLKKNKKRKLDDQNRVADELTRRFYDIRAFGAVMSTGDNPAGQRRGPIQLACPAVSVETGEVAELGITRVTVTKEEDLNRVSESDSKGEGPKFTEMGTKFIVPYALFQAKGTFTPSFAKKTDFSARDLEIFWDALVRMWSLDRSASRGITGCAGIHIFTHGDAFGRARAADLYQLIKIQRISEGPARKLGDYAISVDTTDLPDGITYTRIG